MVSGNRWGLDINQKLSASSDNADAPNKINLIAKLESEFELPSGDLDTPGVLFNRDAWLGIQSKAFGKLTVGRQALYRAIRREFGATRMVFQR